MSIGRRSWTVEESGAANWIRATLELRRSHQAASRIPLRENVGRGSTSCSAVSRVRAVSLGLPELKEPVQGIRKLVLEAGTLTSIPPPVRSSLATTAGLKGGANFVYESGQCGAQKSENKRGDIYEKKEDCNIKKTKIKQRSAKTSTRITPSLRHILELSR
ncbi:hypothetical protein NDU88_002860 [Pleurodeles waltl]|uniref:Uncharacterized protein n=1 Tax=Pleurodeles waltl TaxID=8319 RepID=A0AAV7W0I4_PLEWA|nr:hypothetical protein NDU88_002860 [Pleurodeles waltl]